MAKSNDLKVFISSRNSTCEECKADLGQGAWIYLQPENGALCLACADLDHLTFLRSGDAALTRRSKKYSKLSAVVLKWAKRRRRYERQGLLVEEAALERAEQECLADADARALQRERAAVKRAELDQEYIKEFTARVRALYPGCPKGRERIIAEHACQKYSGRVGRSASAKELDEKAVELAVVAHIRHMETDYDVLLVKGVPRTVAREKVLGEILGVLKKWEK
jgi:hypothetical protein